MEFADGALEFAVFLVVAFVGLVWGYYTRTGSGIDEHPYGKIYGGAPGAMGPSSVSGRDPRAATSWSRGAR